MAQIVAPFVEPMQTADGQAAMQKAYQRPQVTEKDDSFYDGFGATLSAAGVDIAELCK